MRHAKNFKKTQMAIISKVETILFFKMIEYTDFVLNTTSNVYLSIMALNTNIILFLILKNHCLKHLKKCCVKDKAIAKF